MIKLRKRIINKMQKSLYFLSCIFTFIVFSNFFNIPAISSTDNEIIKKSHKYKNLKLEKIKNNALQENFYILGAGDQLNLNVIGLPELKKNINILNDGTVTLPIIGAKKIEGLTINGAARHIESLLSEELINPQVELNLLEARPVIVSIIGEVSRPGIYNLGTKKNDLPTLINSIENAGGLSKKADLSRINLKRRIPGNEYAYKETNLNLRKLILNGDFQQNPYLFDGDIINIEKAKNPDDNILAIASTSLSPKTITVNFIGEVARPGTTTVKGNSTLIDGIFSAGGPKEWRSNYGYVEILRMNRDGSAFRKRYRINLAANYSENNNPLLMDGDSIWVRKNNFAKATDILGNVTNPVRDLLSIWTLFRLVD